MNHFSMGLWHATKSRIYMTTSHDQLSGETEKKLQSTSQSQTCTKKLVVVTVWLSAAGLIHYSFLNPSKTISFEKYLSKSMRCTENCNACSQHWSTERAQFFSTMPNCTSHNQCLKSWTNWARKFCLIHHTWSLTNQLQLLQASHNCLQGKCVHNQQEAENAFQEFMKSRSMDFYITWINKLTSHQQKCIDCNGSCFD